MALLEDMVSPERIGILGGSFNPIHWGHLIAAEVAADRLKLDSVLFLVAACSPFKQDTPQLSAEQRLRLCKLAVKDDPRFDVSDIELQRPAPSYTVDSLKALRKLYGVRTEFFFIAGADILESLDQWHQVSELAQLAQFVIVNRAGASLDSGRLKDLEQRYGFSFHILSMPAIDISSTSIREQISQGLSVRYQVPPAVAAAITAHGFYLTGDEHGN